MRQLVALSQSTITLPQTVRKRRVGWCRAFTTNANSFENNLDWGTATNQFATVKFANSYTAITELPTSSRQNSSSRSWASFMRPWTWIGTCLDLFNLFRLKASPDEKIPNGVGGAHQHHGLESRATWPGSPTRDLELAAASRPEPNGCVLTASQLQLTAQRTMLRLPSPLRRRSQQLVRYPSPRKSNGECLHRETRPQQSPIVTSEPFRPRPPGLVMVACFARPVRSSVRPITPR